ncbi:Mhp1p Ecym_8241 [Eremothecium cymbalariae DBVPG|uniref:Uncharacterized protein n=1 Tax=Eremothecium cymbalariae (strain CBS 270.75 / DBVPG 7215 / KCTC 17166 / NRRL Y-17582) TaxID=931890 RepID=G8JXF1_ERECY|nr:Hypothetical protein Ecym_8241 [Eremothecium cymbalariae DBVPG\
MNDLKNCKETPFVNLSIPKINVDWLITCNRNLGCKSKEQGAGGRGTLAGESRAGYLEDGGRGERQPVEKQGYRRNSAMNIYGEKGVSGDFGEEMNDLRRTRSLSIDNRGHTSETRGKKHGIWARMFGIRPERGCNERRMLYNSSAVSRLVKNRKRISVSAGPSVERGSVRSSSPRSEGAGTTQSARPSKGIREPNRLYESKKDAKLTEFLKYYKVVGFSVFQRQLQQLDHQNSSKCILSTLFPQGSEPTLSMSITDTLEDKPCPTDTLGRPIPPHPAKPRLKPALKRTRKISHVDSTSVKNKSDNSATNKFGAFLKRVTSYSADGSNNSSLSSVDLNTEDQKVCPASSGMSTEPANLMPKFNTIPGLEDLKPLRRVSFSMNTYFNNPPQQICSTNPRKGEVEVMDDNSVVIHRLTAAEKRELVQNSSCGVVVGGTGHLKFLQKPLPSEVEVESIGPKVEEQQDKLKSQAKSSEKLTTIEENQSTDIKVTEIEAGVEISSSEEKCKTANDEEDVTVNTSIENAKIDKPMLRRRAESPISISSAESSIDISSSDDMLPPPNPEIPNNILYTRCCYLREILPIPATLNQLKQDSADPVPLLQLRNPKPSMVEVLAFSDFLSVAPVLCLSMDNVSLSLQMFRLILTSLTYKDTLEKLSLRNTPIDEEGWKVLCYFISKCKSLRALDLTMVPAISGKLPNTSKRFSQCATPRMTCDMTDRSKRNWDLFTAVLATNGGLEEVVLSGAKMSLDEFRNFMQIGCTSIERLGLAYNELSAEQVILLSNWLLESKATGVDIGFNDLNGKMAPFAEVLIRKAKSANNTVSCISLNSTHLEIPPDATFENNDATALLNALGYCVNLKFLDLSNNPKLFSQTLAPLTDLLPVFVNLVRIHLDFNNFKSTDIITLAEVLPMCSSLNYLSILGAPLDIHSSTALSMSIKKSTALFTLDADFENVPDKIKQKISLYSIRNMENALAGGNNYHETQQLSKLQQELAVLLTEKITSNHDELVQKFAQEIHGLRSRLRKVIEQLFKLRVKGELNTEGKEALIRFCFVDASLEKGLHLLAQRYEKKSPIIFDILMQADADTHGCNIKNIPMEQESLKRPLQNNADCIRHVSSVSSLSSFSFQESGHAALLPFHHSSFETLDAVENTVELRSSEPSTVPLQAQEQTKEEGELFKRTRGLIKELKKSAEHRGTTVNTESLKKISDKYDCEQLKDLIFHLDVNKLLESLDTLEARGIPVDSIFKKDPNDPTLINTQSINDSSNEMSDCSLDKETWEHDESSIDVSDTEIIDRAYDEVLNNLEKTRANRETE